MTVTSTKFASIAYNIQNFSGTPEYSTVATGTSNAPDPSTVTPAGGSAEYLWLAAFYMAGEEADDDTWCNSAPSTPGAFGNLTQKTTGTSGAASTNCEVAAADYTSTAASCDPGAFNTDQSLAWRAYTVAISPQPPITISGTSNESDGTIVRVAINGSLATQTGTVTSGNWQITNVPHPNTNDILTVFATDGDGDIDDSLESTAIGKYSGSGDMTGMVLNINTLSVGGTGNQSITLSDLVAANYDADQDEDIMYDAETTSLLVKAAVNSYTAEKMDVLTTDTFTLSDNATLTTYDMTINGTLVSGTSSTFNVSHNWTNNGTFTQSTSTVVMNGSTAQTINGSTATAFYNLTISNTSAAIAISTNMSIVASGTLNMNGANTILNPDAGVIISGAGTLTGSGTVKVTRTAATADFSSQYTITNKTLTNLNVDYAGTGQVLSNLTYGNLTISGTNCITTGTNTATVGSTFTVSSTFTPSGGTMTFNNGSSIVNSGTLTFQNISIANSATVTTSASFNIAGTLTVGSSANFSPSDGTITMSNAAWTISNSGTLVFKNLTIDATPSSQPTASFSVSGSLTINSGKTLAPTSGTITMTGGSINNSGTLSFYNLTISGSTSTTSTFGITNDLTVNGTLTVSSGEGVITVNGNVTGSGTMNLTAGTFQQVVGTANKTFGSSSNANNWTFNNLKFNNSSGVAGRVITPNAGTGQIIVNGTLTLGDSGTQTITFDNESYNDRIFDLNGDFVIGSQGIFSASSTQTFNIGGSYTNNGLFTANSGLVTFDAGSSGKTLSGTLNGSSAFNQLTFDNGSGGWTINNNLEVTGAFNLANGSLTQGADIDFLLKGNVTLANGTTFTNASSGTGLFKLDGNPSQTFEDQHLVTKVDLGNVVIGQSPGTTTLKSDMSATSLTIKTSDTLNTKGYDVTLSTYLDCQGNCTLNLTDTAPNNENDGTIITVGTNWTMSSSGNFIPYTNSKVYFNGTGNQTIITGGKPFWDVEFNNTGSPNDDLIISGTLDIDGNLTITDGELLLSTNNPNVNTAGNVSVGASGAITKGSGTWTFNGSGTNTWADSSAGQDFGTVVVNGTTKIINTNSNIKVTSLTIGSDDTLNISDDTLTLLGSGTPLVINSGGTFTTDSSTVVYAGSEDTNITTTAYNNLTLDPVSGTPTYSLTGNLTTTKALTGSLTISNDGALDTTSSNYNITLGGSWDNNGTFTANNSTVTFNANSGSKTIEAGNSSFYNVVFNSSTGNWTIQTDNLTATNNFTITDVSSLAIAASKIVEVDGIYSVANAAASAITWNSNSVLYLNSGTAYTVGSKNQTPAIYAVLQIGANTDIRMWNSTASSFNVDASGSLYSQNHANNNGDLYIWGDYHTQTNDYWSYETDFDGTNLSGGSERQVDVRIDPSSNVTVDSGDTLAAIGAASPNRTTVSRQGGSGGYGITVASGGTINFQYTDFDYLEGTTGLNIQSGATVTSLNYTSFDNLVGSEATNDAYITLASSIIGSGTKTITGVNFDKSDPSVEFNVNRTGDDDTGYWTFSSGTGDLYGEAYDGKNGVNEADPGMLRWDDSNSAPTSPDSLLTEGETNPTNVTDNTPEFSAVYNDPNAGDTANAYQIQVDDDPEFGSPIWDSGQQSMTDCHQGSRCQDISYGGSTLAEQKRYYWRIKYWDNGGLEGAWSTEEAYFELVATTNRFNFRNIRLHDLRVKPNN